MKYSVTLLFLLISACSTDFYQPVSDRESAYVSFSNLSPENPEISIVKDCEQSQIDPEYIKFRKPSEHSSSLLKIPSNQPISFVYSYAWFEGEIVQLVNKGYRYYQRIEKTTTKDVNSCAEKVTFVPEPGRSYEVYFGKNTKSCVIGVSKALTDPASRKKHLLEVKLVTPPEC